MAIQPREIVINYEQIETPYVEENSFSKQCLRGKARKLLLVAK